jgi:hypothetical protein
MRRREFVVGFCTVAAWPSVSRAEQVKTYRVGLLASRPVGEGEERRKAIKEVLAENGFVEGRNLQFEARWGDPLAENVEALKAAKVDVIITFGYPAALAAKTMATEVSVVCSGAGDPVATGLAQSLARPGGNLTGVTELATELSAKRLEILKDAIPNLKCQRSICGWERALRSCGRARWERRRRPAAHPDRAATLDLLMMLKAIADRGALFTSLSETWADTTTAAGRLMLTILGGLAEFERELIKARTAEGRERAKGRGVRMGRKHKLTPHQMEEVRERKAEGQSVRDLGRSYNVSPNTISRVR